MLHVHLVDPTAALADLMALPHVGTRVSDGDGRALGALVDHLRSEVGRRRATTQVEAAAARDPALKPTVLVVVDGWEQLVEAHPDTTWASPVDDLLRVLRDGAAVGVVGAVAGGRSLLQPRWSGIADTTLLLGRLDPLDLALAGLRPADVPTEPPPGRGIRLADRREVQLATADAASPVRQVHPSGPTPKGAAWRYRPLPPRVDLPPMDRSDDDSGEHVADVGSRLDTGSGVAGDSARRAPRPDASPPARGGR